MSELPPEDLPSGAGLVPGREEDAARDAGPMTPDNPIAVAAMFYSALTAEAGPDLEILRAAVTPESLPNWGDFGWARELLTGYGMTTRAERRPDGIAYARFVPSPDQTMRADGDLLMSGVQILTLIWRPDLQWWQVFGLGDYWRPEGPIVEEELQRSRGARSLTVNEAAPVLDELSRSAAAEQTRFALLRDNRPETVLLAAEDLAALETTLEVLSDASSMAAVAESLAELDRGEPGTDIEELRRLLANRSLAHG